MRVFIRATILVAMVLAGVGTAAADDLKVTGIKAVCHDGQTFVTWKDLAEGEAGAAYRYSLYRSDRPIAQADLEGPASSGPGLKPVIAGILNNSAKQYGYDLFAKTRIDPSTPMATIIEGGRPLPQWSGLAVHTVAQDAAAYYAVVATDAQGKPVTQVVPGGSATTEPVAEKVAPIAPVKTGDSKERGRYAAVVKVTGQKGLPLMVNLHASSSRGGPGYDHGDYYLFWGRPEWGYRDGLPWQFTVHERDYGESAGRRLELNARETMAHPDGQRSIETYWFGYYCVPQWAEHPEPRAYDFTERRMPWLIGWVVKKYGVDPERVYAGGGSMGAWGSSTFAFRHGELFAAVYPNRPRTRQQGLPALAKLERGKPVLMDDGKTDYYERMDMTRFAVEHPEDLPFLGWCCGRRDGFATFAEQIDMVKAMTAAHHGFAFAWNDGDHSSGSAPMREVLKYYPPHKFARNRSYPAFGHSSIDDDPGSGELEEKTVDGKKARALKDGELEGGINLGFAWSDVADEPGRWSAKISNSLCKDQMTVDVTPRRCQRFKPKPGEKLTWTSSTGDTGQVVADRWGLVTVEKLKIQPGQPTVLTIAR